eukprot:TRINITY_DN17025_c0_g2_i1.p1 TRINITY_DN17025_c0_g2~~TRINITY_DN17025_c0_g2_i1.p1  ORF type:complete len:373 (-),score=31.18 TRINITY_DN17025_c0_g2_i1:84-1202(-)
MASALATRSSASKTPSLMYAVLAHLRIMQKRLPTLTTKARITLILWAFAMGISSALVERKRSRETKDCVTLSERWLRHPMRAWLTENSSCIIVALANTVFVPRPKHGSYATAALYIFTGGAFTEWTIVALMTWCARRVYRHVEYFNGADRATPSLTAHGKDWSTCNMLVDTFNGLMLGMSIAAFTRKQHYHAYVKRSFSPPSFLLKYAIVRICVDIFFWVGHRALHHPSLYWLHRRHHEHFRPSTATNFHFNPVDLWVEAVLPFMAGMMALNAVGLKLSRIETNLLSSYLVWHEAGSHCGKPMPCVTYFPPLAPLYQVFLGDVDQKNVKHHDVHHARLNCNYSIVIWPDILMGTRVVDHRDKILREKEAIAS